MQTVLQISDFHITTSSNAPHENKVFTSLIDKIQRLKLENIILVYNGDVIDARDIASRTDPACSDSEKAEFWDSEASKAYSIAKEYFHYMCTQLNIPNDKIIICCGNHDVNTNVVGDIKLSCPSKDNVVLFSPHRFTQFEFFCNQLQLQRHTAGTHFREIGDLNFLVINSNWRNKWAASGSQQKLCISCNEVISQIASKQWKLQHTKDNHNKTCNILVSHAPRTDYCEEALYPYEQNNYSTATEYIDRYFGLKLYGDKHTNSIQNFDYIVGAPLTENRITCGIHEFDESHHHRHRVLRFANNAWEVVGSEDYIDEILKVSEDSISQRSLEYLFGANTPIDLAQIIRTFDEVRADDKWLALDKLFRSTADIKIPQAGTSGIHINSNDGFINTLTRLIADSHQQVALAVRGEPRVGKSVCMSLLYMNLLHRFICGTFEYLPVYINIEELHAKHARHIVNRDTNTYLSRIKTALTKRLKNGIKLAQQLQRPTCCIIDGLNRYLLYSNAEIENLVSELLDSQNGLQYDRIIYSIDTNSDCNQGTAPQHIQRNAEHLVYFNRILTKKATSVRKFTTMIGAFCELMNEEDQVATHVINNIEKMQIWEVDTNLLNLFWSDLRNPDNTDTSYFKLIDSYANSKIPIHELAKTAHAAYLYSKGCDYSSIRSTCGISNEIFDLIRTQKLLLKYLIAVNYVVNLEKSTTDEWCDECLNELHTHEIGTLIREYVSLRKLQGKVQRFVNNKYSQLSDGGRATATYLLGRITDDHGRVTNRVRDISGFLDTAYSTYSNKSEHNDRTDEYLHNIAMRSIRISKIFVSSNPAALLKDYIHTLIRDKHERMINRVFYLQYYGDRSFDDEDGLTESFDIYYTYNLLAHRLNKWMETGNRYALLELEIFTLCDLIQIRLDTPYTQSSKKQTHSFFYNSKFNMPKDAMALNVIVFIRDIITQYLKVYGNISDNTLFIRYLTTQLKRFEKAHKTLLIGPLMPHRDEYMPLKLLEQLSQIADIKRTGWLIKDSKADAIGGSEWNALQMNKEIIETTLIHTFESYLIGLLYLPSTSINTKSYNKQTILNILLIHDFGETEVGDILPLYEHYEKSRTREREFCEELFLQGTHFGVADLTHQFDLWQAWCDGAATDINVKIAKEIDKIQMLYKLLVLLRDDRVTLSDDRIKDFWSAKNAIYTPEGKAVFNTIIANGSFDFVANKHGISIACLA